MLHTLYRLGAAASGFLLFLSYSLLQETIFECVVVSAAPQLKLGDSCVIRRGETPDLTTPCEEWRLQALFKGRSACPDLIQRDGDRWIVDEDAIKSVGGDVQFLLDCIPDWEAVVFTVDVLELKSTINITRPVLLTFSDAKENSTARMEVKCPPVSPAFQIRAKEVVIANIAFTDCNSNTSSVVIIDPDSNVTFANVEFAENANSNGAGCIAASNAAVTLQNCSFLRNSGLQGGAAFMQGNSVLSVVHSRFEGNTAVIGGAIKANDSSVHITESVFVENKAEDFGGAIDIEGDSQNLTVNIRNVAFAKNSVAGPQKNLKDHNSGGAVAIRGQLTGQISESTFYDNSAMVIGGAVLASNTTALDISNTSFHRNAAFQGGAVAAHTVEDGSANATVSIHHVVFEGNWVEGRIKGADAAGGALSIANIDDFKMDACDFVNNTALDNGGGLSLKTVLTGSIRNTNFLNNSAATGGGLFTYAEKSVSNVTMENVSFTANAAEVDSGLGGAMHVYGSRMSVNVMGSSFNDNSAKTGGGIQMSSAQVSIVKSNFANNVALESMGGAINAWEAGGWLYVLDTLFVNNIATLGGALAGVNGTQIEVSGTTFQQNTALRHGGALHCLGGIEQVHVTVEDSQFVENSANEGGGAVNLEGRVISTFQEVKFDRNRGAWGGAMQVVGRTRVSVVACTCIENHAEIAGGCMYLEHASETTDQGRMVVSIEESVFLDNHAGWADNGRVALNATSLAGQGGGLFITGPRIFVTVEQSVVVNNTAVYGGGICWDKAGRLGVTDSSITDNRALVGGGMHAQLLDDGTERFEVERVKFVRNRARKGGGMSLYSSHDPFKSLANMDYVGQGRVANLTSVEFLNNTASQRGGAVDLEEAMLACQNCSFTVNKAGRGIGKIGSQGKGGGINVGENGVVMLNASRIESNVADRGGGVSVENGGLNCTDVAFVGNVGWKLGGAVALQYGSTATTRSGVLMSCTSCNVAGNNASIGGGIHVTVEKASKELKQCANLDESSEHSRSTHKDELDLMAMCSGLSGFYELLAKRHISLQEIILSDNHASTYGSAISTDDPRHVEICCGGDCELANHQSLATPCQIDGDIHWHGKKDTDGKKDADHKKDVDMEEVHRNHSKAVVPSVLSSVEMHPSLIRNHASGMPLPPIEVTLKTQDGKVASGQSVTLLIEANGHNIMLRNSKRTVSMQNGIMEVTDVTVRAVPGNYTLKFMFMLEASTRDTIDVVDLPVEVRDCVLGEVYAHHSLSCTECDEDSFTFDVNGKCSPCPDNAHCNRSTVTPMTGFWHPTSKSASPAQCLYKEACSYENRTDNLASIAYRAHQQGQVVTWESDMYDQCAEGYIGPLCGACESGYGRMHPVACEKCATNWVAAFLIILSLLVLLGIAAFLTCQAFQYEQQRQAVDIETDDLDQPSTSQPRSSIESDKGTPSASDNVTVVMPDDGPYVEKEIVTDEGWECEEVCVVQVEVNRMLEVSKILINFLQVLGVAAAIDPNWTNAVFKTLAVSGFVSGAPVSGWLLQFDCVFGSTDTARSVKSYAVQCLSPYAIWIILAIYWMIRKVKRKLNGTQCLQRLIVGFLVVLWVSYLNTTTTVFRMFRCMDINVSTDPEQETMSVFWREDTSTQCFRGSHGLLVGLVGAPTLVLVIAGYPVGLILKFLICKQRLGNRECTACYGFHYKAYRNGVRSWEVLVLARKTILAAVLVFSDSISATWQGTLASIVLMIVLMLQIYFKPYSELLSRLNTLESLSITAQAFVFISGVMFAQISSSNGVSTLLTFAVFGCIIAFLLVILYELGRCGIALMQAWMIRENLTQTGRLFVDAQTATAHCLRRLKRRVLGFRALVHPSRSRAGD